VAAAAAAAAAVEVAPAQVEVALGRLAVAPAPAVTVAGPVVECPAAAHRGQTLVVRRRLASPVAAAPRNCRPVDRDLQSAAADPILAVGRRSCRVVVGRTSGPAYRNCRPVELVPAERAGLRRCRQLARMSAGDPASVAAQASQLFPPPVWVR
jgi:hypothetical protein